jgi:hypothetical protein
MILLLAAKYTPDSLRLGETVNSLDAGIVQQDVD